MSDAAIFCFSHQTAGLSSGGCKLGAGRALTFHARQAGVLSIRHGRVWLTFNNAEQDLRVRAGDHFLDRGESLSLSAGESVVMESFGLGQTPSACFGWEPAQASPNWSLFGRLSERFWRWACAPSRPRPAPVAPKGS